MAFHRMFNFFDISSSCCEIAVVALVIMTGYIVFPQQPEENNKTCDEMPIAFRNWFISSYVVILQEIAE